MNDLAPNEFVVTCVEENEDGSADIEVELGSEMRNHAISEGINFLMIKGILEGTTEDILRWAERGKRVESSNDFEYSLEDIHGPLGQD
jgi:hypothetical protein